MQPQVSPSTQPDNYGVKLFKYRTAGVIEYWIVNPMTQIVNMYNLEKEKATAQCSFAEAISYSVKKVSV